MSRSDLGFGLGVSDQARRDDARKTGVVIGGTVAFAVLAIVWALFWLDRPTPPVPGETMSPAWLRAPVQGFEREKRP